MKKLKNIDILLIIILSVAAFLRLYNINNMHLFNDELSALSRTHYNSFHDLINFGSVPISVSRDKRFSIN